MAIYREALLLNSLPYRFLGFYKIINIKLKDGKSEQLDWINKALIKLEDPHVLERLEKLKQMKKNVGKHLWGSCRASVAHAYDSRALNPDDFDHVQRLSEDIDVIKALAEYMMINELKIPPYP